ncbi:MAG: type 4 pilus major pilin [Aestuariivita sp.]|nr:type 4 pilus major pilin [Aestuariivita sp.]MCY4345406.1 type 4 pilus major pilin [Aestuariivita sp.]
MTYIATCNNDSQRRDDAIAAALGARAAPADSRSFPCRRRRGISIFGVILGVAVAAAASIGLVNAYQGVMNNVRGDAVASLVLQSSTSIRRAFANSSTFVGGGDSIEAIIYSSAPENLQNAAGSAATAGISFPWWAGATLGDGTPLNAASFTLALANVPPAVCENVAARYINTPDVQGVYIAHGNPPNATGTAVTEVNVGSACAAADETASVSIRFRG